MDIKKKALSLAIAAAMAPGIAAAAVDVGGFADVRYTITDEAADVPGEKNPNEGKFTAEGEVNFTAGLADNVTVRADIDLFLDPAGEGNSAVLEQVFMAWGVTPDITVIGGVFNNPIGYEGEDTTDWWGSNSGVVRNILVHQTALHGNNVAGLAVAGGVGPVTITGAILNDLAQTDEKNSFALVVGGSPLDGLNLELGFVTQETGAENVHNFNASYVIPGIDGLSVAVNILSAGEIVDNAYELMVDYRYDVFGAGLRFESVSWDAADADDSERLSFHISYHVSDHLKAILEFADGDDKNPMTDITGIQPDKLTTLQLLATF